MGRTKRYCAKCGEKQVSSKGSLCKKCGQEVSASLARHQNGTKLLSAQDVELYNKMWAKTVLRQNNVVHKRYRDKRTDEQKAAARDTKRIWGEGRAP